MADSDEIQTDKEDSPERDMQSQRTEGLIEKRMDKLESMFETAMKAMKRKRQATECSDYSDDNAYDEFEEYEKDNNGEEEDAWLTVDEELETAEEINVNVANYIDTKLTKRLTNEQLKTKIARQQRPKNVKYAREVKINSAIYNRLNSYAKKRDSSYKRIQGLMARSVVAMGKVAQDIIAMQKEKVSKKSVVDWSKSMYNNVFDGITLASQASYHINMRRVSINCIIY